MRRCQITPEFLAKETKKIACVTPKDCHFGRKSALDSKNLDIMDLV